MVIALSISVFLTYVIAFTIVLRSDSRTIEMLRTRGPFVSIGFKWVWFLILCNNAICVIATYLITQGG